MIANPPAILVGITTRNRAHILPRAIRSALSQQCPNVRVTVLDDASTDATPALREQFPEVTWIRHEQAKGIIESRNELMRTADADFYVSLDDDAWFMRGDELELAASRLAHRQRVTAIAFDILSPDRPQPVERANPKITGMFIGCGHMLRLRAAREVGFYTPSPGTYGSEEKDLCLRLADRGYVIEMLPGVHVWHEKAWNDRDNRPLHRSGVCNEFVLTLRRCPLPDLFVALPWKLLMHVRFWLSKPFYLSAGVCGFFDFLRHLPGAWSSRGPVRRAIFWGSRNRDASDAKHIAISCGRLSVGGPETHVLCLCELLRLHGASVTIFGTGCDWSSTTMGRLREIGVRHRLPPRWTRSRRALAVAASVVTWLPAILRRHDHLLLIGAGSSHALAQRLVRPRRATIYHELVLPPHINTEASMAARCMRLSNVLVANSRSAAEAMAPFASDKSLRTLPFLTTTRQAPPTARPAASGERVLQIGYLGRLDVRKRPDMLVKNWRQIAKLPDVAPAVLHVYGTDKGTGMAASLARLVEDQRLGDDVKLHGEYSRSELPKIFAGLDLIVLPSTWEGLPLVLVEAMEHGVSFVATCAGGTAELGADNPDVEITTLDWDDFLAGLGRQARKIRAGTIDDQRLQRHVRSRFGYDAVAPLWLELFELD